jgi:hypothetical protein
VIIANLDVERVTVSPDEADPPLFVDPDAVLPGSITPQGFEPVSRRHPQRIKVRRCVQYDQLSSSRLFDAIEAADT